jgi:hypothetical protein
VPSAETAYWVRLEVLTALSLDVVLLDMVSPR